MHLVRRTLGFWDGDDELLGFWCILTLVPFFLLFFHTLNQLIELAYLRWIFLVSLVLFRLRFGHISLCTMGARLLERGLFEVVNRAASFYFELGYFSTQGRRWLR